MSVCIIPFFRAVPNGRNRAAVRKSDTWQSCIHSTIQDLRVRGPIHSKLNCAFNRVKKLHVKMKLMFSGTAQVTHQLGQFFCQFCVSSGNDLYASVNARIAILLFILED
jgi:hypothetical protein